MFQFCLNFILFCKTLILQNTVFLPKIKVLECKILNLLGLRIKWDQKYELGAYKIIQAKEHESLNHDAGSKNGKEGNFKKILTNQVEIESRGKW